MKKTIKYISHALAFALLICFSSCTGDFEKINTNPFGVTDEDLYQDNNSIGQHFTALQQSIYFNFDGGSGTDWTYQLFQNLNADIWSGYLATPSNFEGGVNNQTYSLISGWNDYCWNETYNHIMSNSLRVKEKCLEQGFETYYHFDAINTVLRVLAMSRICDQYGAVIYSRYGEELTGGVYDSGPDAYKLFFKELDEAVKALEKTIGNEAASFSKFDMAYDGDFTKWMKLANTIRLRLAIRIVKYDAALAREQAEAAVNAPQGLILTDGDIFRLSGQGYRNPLYTLSMDWSDIFINANVVSILGGYQDARLSKFGIPKSDNKVMGVRSGIPGLDKNADEYKRVISNVNIASTSTPVILCTAAESYFLLAEAALRGWNVGGDAETFYEQGIKASFEQWGVNVGDYLESSLKPGDWIDPLVDEFNMAAASQVTPKWEDAKTNEERLEKIVTQKWIAMFPEGMNAWAEWRRTGYPKLFPIGRNESQGVIPTELGVRRLPFTVSEKSNNPEGYAEAVRLLGGTDNGATRVFWDINKPNI
ncbi:MAG: SusD/RagB family nutrient-binding outer membrane lipoprotein [Tannerellaceae bacterium]|jgi:hypothetical protein|nr:SusD/RagB family nutrient-binding outer membrane lipoprotein [Tannerellaceae bacterium]